MQIGAYKKIVEFFSSTGESFNMMLFSIIMKKSSFLIYFFYDFDETLYVIDIANFSIYRKNIGVLVQVKGSINFMFSLAYLYGLL